MDAVTALTSIIELAELVAPKLANSEAVAKIIASLVQLVPLIVKEAQALIPIVKNVIAALTSNDATTAAQLAQLRALDAQLDAAFDATVDKAEAEDAAAQN